MQSVIRSIFVLFLLGFFTAASAQLPPKVIADKYLIQAEQLIEKKDYIAALNMVEKIIALQNEHNLTLSDEFHFKYAQVAFSVGSMQTALDAVGKYLSTETEGEFYKEALALLVKIEEELKKSEFSSENMCIGKPAGSSCWMALTNHPECYVWNPHLLKDETVTWSGECSEGFAQGKGTITWAVTDGDSLKILETGTGHLQNGNFHGQWILREIRNNRYGIVREVSYMHGKRHGDYVRRISNGVVLDKGSYVNGELHGHWVFTNGLPWRRHIVSKGSYVNGKMHGQWIWREMDGDRIIETKTATYVNGEEQ